MAGDPHDRQPPGAWGQKKRGPGAATPRPQDVGPTHAAATAWIATPPTNPLPYRRPAVVCPYLSNGSSVKHKTRGSSAFHVPAGARAAVDRRVRLGEASAE